MTARETPFDALFLVSFGGPEKLEDVMPFLDNVLRGKNVPHERKLEVAENYHRLGGRSPMNPFMRGLKKEVEKNLAARNIPLSVYWGNRNWTPYLREEIQNMYQDGVRRPLVFLTSAYGSYSGCRQYREDIERALVESSLQEKLVFSKLPRFYRHPKFIQANVHGLQKVWADKPFRPDTDQLIFSAHSLPSSMASVSPYVSELQETATRIAQQVNAQSWVLAYQSRSGPPSQPWLEPDVRDAIKAARDDGKKSVTVAPIGFVNDHMEVIYDLDVQAKDLAISLGLEFLRSETAGNDPLFAELIGDLVEEALVKAPIPECLPGCCSVDARARKA